MSNIENFLSRKQVRERCGFSYSFIDRRLPRVKIGGKVLIPRDALDRLLSGKDRDNAAA